MEQEYTAEKWVHTAVKGIRFKPDRLAVEAELREHLEDKTADMARIFHIEGGEAEREALKRMGNPEEIGKALAKLHKPWLGYLWLASKIACWLLIPLALFYLMILDYHGDNVQGGLGYRSARSLTPPTAVEPARAELGNYTFRVAWAVVYSENTICIDVRAASPRFWERIAMIPEKHVTVILEDGTRLDLGAEPSTDEKAVHTTMGHSWDIFYRDARIYVHNIPCQAGDRVTVELEFPIGTVSLSARLSERGTEF